VSQKCILIVGEDLLFIIFPDEVKEEKNIMCQEIDFIFLVNTEEKNFFAQEFIP